MFYVLRSKAKEKCMCESEGEGDRKMALLRTCGAAVRQDRTRARDSDRRP